MRRPVRLLQVVDSLQPGGMENMLVQVLSHLDPGDISAEIVCVTRGGPFEERLPAHVKVHVLDKLDGFRWSTVRKLRDLMRRGAFDVVHTHHLGGLICFCLARGIRRAPALVHSEHMLWSGEDLSRKRRWQRKLLYPLASAITTVSQQQLDQMLTLGFRHPRMAAVINGVSFERFGPAQDRLELRRKLNLAPEARWLGMVARFGPQKRHADLIEAFEAVAAACPGLNLLLVGDGGPERERVLARLEASPWRSRMYWAGFQQNPAPWYQAMDALVVSSANEGMPNAVLEGMASGLPLMANDVCGVREIAVGGEHGWIEDLGSVAKLSAGLKRLAAVPAEELARLGAASREHVQEHFSLEAAVQKYRTLFASVAGDALHGVDAGAD